MALRNQPYFPLYVQDFLTDEKLIECSASANGIYIRIMCIMHKSTEYGVILLKQKDKQNNNQVLNFAIKLSRQMPFSINEIESALIELIEQNVLIIEDDKLIQKRMRNDGIISEKRSTAGKKGAKNKKKSQQKNAKAKFQTNCKQNTEYEDEDENEYEIDNIYGFIEFYLSRTLSPIEYEIINKWLNEFDEEIIKKAVKETAINRASNLKYTQKILDNWKNKSYDEIIVMNKKTNNSNSILSKCDDLERKGEI